MRPSREDVQEAFRQMDWSSEERGELAMETGMAVDLEAMGVMRWPRECAWGEKKEGPGLSPRGLLMQGGEEEPENALEQGPPRRRKGNPV